MYTIVSLRFSLVSALGQCATFFPFRLIAGSIYPMHKKNASVWTFWKKLVLFKTRWTRRTVIVFHHPWYENYYHWTTECLPRLFYCLKENPNATIVLPATLASFHKQHLDLLDIPHQKFIFIDNDCQLFANTILFVPIDNLIFGKHEFKALNPLIEIFRSKVPVAETSKGRYYLTRKNAPKRRAINEKEVIATLESYGFESKTVEELSVKEQFKLFSGAYIVVGVHGSYFVNAICMPPQTHVIDVMEKNHNDSCYENLLTPLGIMYHYLLSEGLGPAETFRDNDILVDCNKLEDLLKKLL